MTPKHPLIKVIALISCLSFAFTSTLGYGGDISFAFKPLTKNPAYLTPLSAEQSTGTFAELVTPAASGRLTLKINVSTARSETRNQGAIISGKFLNFIDPIKDETVGWFSSEDTSLEDALIERVSKNADISALAFMRDESTPVEKVPWMLLPIDPEARTTTVKNFLVLLRNSGSGKYDVHEALYGVSKDSPNWITARLKGTAGRMIFVTKHKGNDKPYDTSGPGEPKVPNPKVPPERPAKVALELPRESVLEKRTFGEFSTVENADEFADALTRSELRKKEETEKSPYFGLVLAVFNAGILSAITFLLGISWGQEDTFKVQKEILVPGYVKLLSSLDQEVRHQAIAKMGSIDSESGESLRYDIIQELLQRFVQLTSDAQSNEFQIEPIKKSLVEMLAKSNIQPARSRFEDRFTELFDHLVAGTLPAENTSETNSNLQLLAVQTLEFRGGREAISKLLEILDQQSGSEVRSAAIQSLKNLAAKQNDDAARAREALSQALSRPRSETRQTKSTENGKSLSITYTIDREKSEVIFSGSSEDLLFVMRAFSEAAASSTRPKEQTLSTLVYGQKSLPIKMGRNGRTLTFTRVDNGKIRVHYSAKVGIDSTVEQTLQAAKDLKHPPIPIRDRSSRVVRKSQQTTRSEVREEAMDSSDDVILKQRVLEIFNDAKGRATKVSQAKKGKISTLAADAVKVIGLVEKDLLLKPEILESLISTLKLEGLFEAVTLIIFGIRHHIYSSIRKSRKDRELFERIEMASRRYLRKALETFQENPSNEKLLASYLNPRSIIVNAIAAILMDAIFGDDNFDEDDSDLMDDAGFFRSEVRTQTKIENVVHVAYEMTPFFGVGGIKDVMRELLPEFGKAGYHTSLIMPGHKKIFDGAIPIEKTGKTFDVNGVSFEIAHAQIDHVDVYFLLSDGLFQHGYDEKQADTFKEAALFSRAVTIALDVLGLHPDIVHAHDWQVALVPAFLKTVAHQKFPDTASVFTIHNLGYPGNFPAERFHELVELGFPKDGYQKEGHRGLEFYGQGALIKAGILFADKITTVSYNYRNETLEPEFGERLEGLLKTRGDDYVGVPNALTYERWDPERLDPPFSVNDTRNKNVHKTRFQAKYGLNVDETKPLISLISRLAPQKGLDLVVQEIENIIEKLDAQVLVLGMGEKEYEDAFEQFEKKYPGRFKFLKLYNETVSNEVYRAADFFLTPSKYEPFGLTPLFAMRFGTIPIVHDVGGLHDSVVDPDEEPGRSNGFKFSAYDSREFFRAVSRGVNRYRKSPEDFHAMQIRAMTSVASWKNIVPIYKDVYKSAQIRHQARTELRSSLEPTQVPIHKIFVADDESNIRAEVVKRVQSVFPDAEIVQFDDGAPALEKFDDSVGLIVTDNVMNWMNGVNLITKIRSHKKSNVPAILFTRSYIHTDDGDNVLLVSKHDGYDPLQSALSQFKEEIDRRSEVRAQKGLPADDPSPEETFNFNIAQGRDDYGNRLWPIYTQAMQNAFSSDEAHSLERAAGFFTLDADEANEMTVNPAFAEQRARMSVKTSWMLRRNFELVYRGVLIETSLGAEDINEQVRKVAEGIFLLTKWEEPTDEDIRKNAIVLSHSKKADSLESFIKNLRLVAAWLRTVSPAQATPQAFAKPIVPSFFASAFETFAAAIEQRKLDDFYYTSRESGFIDWQGIPGYGLGGVFTHALNHISDSRSEVRLGEIDELIQHAETLAAARDHEQALRIYGDALRELNVIRSKTPITMTDVKNQASANTKKTIVEDAIAKLKTAAEELKHQNIIHAAIKLAYLYGVEGLQHEALLVSRRLAFGILGLVAEELPMVIEWADDFARIFEARSGELGLKRNIELLRALEQAGISKEEDQTSFKGQLIEEEVPKLERAIRTELGKQESPARTISETLPEPVTSSQVDSSEVVPTASKSIGAISPFVEQLVDRIMTAYLEKHPTAGRRGYSKDDILKWVSTYRNMYQEFGRVNNEYAMEKLGYQDRQAIGNWKQRFIALLALAKLTLNDVVSDLVVSKIEEPAVEIPATPEKEAKTPDSEKAVSLLALPTAQEMAEAAKSRHARTKMNEAYFERTITALGSILRAGEEINTETLMREWVISEASRTMVYGRLKKFNEILEEFGLTREAYITQLKQKIAEESSTTLTQSSLEVPVESSPVAVPIPPAKLVADVSPAPQPEIESLEQIQKDLDSILILHFITEAFQYSFWDEFSRGAVQTIHDMMDPDRLERVLAASKQPIEGLVAARLKALGIDSLSLAIFRAYEELRGISGARPALDALTVKAIEYYGGGRISPETVSDKIQILNRHLQTDGISIQLAEKERRLATKEEVSAFFEARNSNEGRLLGAYYNFLEVHGFPPAVEVLKKTSGIKKELDFSRALINVNKRLVENGFLPIPTISQPSKNAQSVLEALILHRGGAEVTFDALVKSLQIEEQALIALLLKFSDRGPAKEILDWLSVANPEQFARVDNNLNNLEMEALTRSEQVDAEIRDYSDNEIKDLAARVKELFLASGEWAQSAEKDDVFYDVVLSEIGAKKPLKLVFKTWGFNSARTALQKVWIYWKLRDGDEVVRLADLAHQWNLSEEKTLAILDQLNGILDKPVYVTDQTTFLSAPFDRLDRRTLQTYSQLFQFHVANSNYAEFLAYAEAQTKKVDAVLSASIKRRLEQKLGLTEIDWHIGKAYRQLINGNGKNHADTVPLEDLQAKLAEENVEIGVDELAGRVAKINDRYAQAKLTSGVAKEIVSLRVSGRAVGNGHDKKTQDLVLLLNTEIRKIFPVGFPSIEDAKHLERIVHNPSFLEVQNATSAANRARFKQMKKPSEGKHGYDHRQDKRRLAAAVALLGMTNREVWAALQANNHASLPYQAEEGEGGQGIDASIYAQYVADLALLKLKVEDQPTTGQMHKALRALPGSQGTTVDISAASRRLLSSNYYVGVRAQIKAQARSEKVTSKTSHRAEVRADQELSQKVSRAQIALEVSRAVSDLQISFDFPDGEDAIEPRAFFSLLDRLERAFDIALSSSNRPGLRSENDVVNMVERRLTSRKRSELRETNLREKSASNSAVTFSETNISPNLNVKEDELKDSISGAIQTIDIQEQLVMAQPGATIRSQVLGKPLLLKKVSRNQIDQRTNTLTIEVEFKLVETVSEESYLASGRLVTHTEAEVSEFKALSPKIPARILSQLSGIIGLANSQNSQAGISGFNLVDLGLQSNTHAVFTRGAFFDKEGSLALAGVSLANLLGSYSVVATNDAEHHIIEQINYQILDPKKRIREVSDYEDAKRSLNGTGLSMTIIGIESDEALLKNLKGYAFVIWTKSIISGILSVTQNLVDQFQASLHTAISA